MNRKSVFYLIPLFLLSYKSRAENDYINNILDPKLSLLTYYDYNSLNYKGVNLNNILDSFDFGVGAAAIFHGGGEGLSYRFKFMQELKFGGGKSSLDAKDMASVQILSYSYSFKDFSFMIGKNIINWDVSYSSQPWFLLNKTSSIAGLEDFFYIQDGTPLISLSYNYNSFSAELFYSDDDLFKDSTYNPNLNKGIKQFAGKFDYNLSTATISFILSKTGGESVNFGTTVSYVPIDSLELHLSLRVKQGSNKYFFSPIYDNNNTNNIVPINQPLRQIFKNSKKWFTNSVIGGQWTDSNNINFIFEWIHDSEKLTKSQLKKYINMVRFHRDISNYNNLSADITERIRNANLSNDALALNRTGIAQDYLFLRLAKSFKSWDLQLQSYTNLYDFSSSIEAIVEYNYKMLVLRAKYSYYLGGSNKEFGILPTKDFLTLAIKLNL